MSDSAKRQPVELSERHYRVRYLLLTLGIFLPLIWAFLGLKNVYPIASWTVMTGRRLERGHQYYLLRGETVSGEVVDIPAIDLTDALSGRNWGLVYATIDNGPFRLRSPHPANASLLLSGAGSFEQPPPAARLPELLQAWGRIYNSRLSASSPHRLKAIRLDAYQWPGKQYSNYDQFIQSWREQL